VTGGGERTRIAGADVIDGTGAARRAADVLIEGDRIVEIAPRSPLSASPAGSRTIDARGLVLSPGFIDMHAHSDLALLTDADHSAKLAQGVTTQVIGQDGIAYAPTTPEVLPLIRRQIRAWNGDLEAADYDWSDVAGYLSRLDRGIPTNAAFLVPQGNLRMMTVGVTSRRASVPELDTMRGILADSLDAGAVGMSSGLTYTPGMFADDDELVELCRVVASSGGYWAPHTRSYGLTALDSFAEALDIGRRSGCPVHLTHATMNFPRNRGRADRLLELVDAAISDGVDVTLDSYPYLPGATTLAALLPSWAHEGGPDIVLARLDDDEARRGMARSLDELGSDGAHGEIVDWSWIQVAGVGDPEFEWMVGLDLNEVAEVRGVSATTAALDLMRDDALGTSILMHIGDEQNVQSIMRHPSHCGGSDGLLVGERPHPRAWGTFARYLARYSRELGVLGLEEMVRHLCGTPARRLGLADRGVVRVGAVADLVLFDPETVSDGATFERPRVAPSGIPFVFVSGRAVIDEGERARDNEGPVLAGRVLRRAPAVR
jgi:N-acyl-D-amino-acid deacylase